LEFQVGAFISNDFTDDSASGIIAAQHMMHHNINKDVSFYFNLCHIGGTISLKLLIKLGSPKVYMVYFPLTLIFAA